LEYTWIYPSESARAKNCPVGEYL